MIYLDLSKTATARQNSGLTRVARRLCAELGDRARPVVWSQWDRRVQPQDWFLTPELFSEAERPGLTEWLEARPCRTAALFHDAIPLQLPHITWPASVARHPGYLKLLAAFDRVLAVSEASRHVLEGFWRWQQVLPRAAVSVVSLGSDFDGAGRVAHPPTLPGRNLLCVGIVEPRKNQGFLLEVASQLWREGVEFRLDVVGRPNPHFGGPLVQHLRRAGRMYPGLTYHPALSDAGLAERLQGARALVFPTIAEGCGLPVLEALWRGVPVVCSDLPVLRENAAAGGCLMLPVNDHAAWAAGLRQMLLDDGPWQRLAGEARQRALPTWRECAQQILAALAS